MKLFRYALVYSLFLVACTTQQPIQNEQTAPAQTASIASSTQAVLSSAENSSTAVSMSSEKQAFVSSAVTSSPVIIRSNLSIPMLVYHHIRDASPWHKTTWSWKMSVSPDVFDTQMNWLQQQGYTTISLGELADILEKKSTGPTKPVVITFDDNQRNAYENGFPVLKKYGLTATFYMVANRLENASFITKEEIQEMLAAGMSIESHTLTHAGLTNLSVAGIDRELTESKRILEELTGQPISHIAYPLTMHSPTVRARVAAAGYRTGSIMDPIPATKSSDLYKLPRIMMTDDTNIAHVLP